MKYISTRPALQARENLIIYQGAVVFQLAVASRKT